MTKIENMTLAELEQIRTTVGLSLKQAGRYDWLKWGYKQAKQQSTEQEQDNG